MLYYDKIKVSEGIDIYKLSKRKFMICHYWYFLDLNYTYEQMYWTSWYINDGLWIRNMAILNVKVVDYRCVIWNITENDAINILNNSKLLDKGSLWIWMFVQNKKHLLK